MTLKSRIWFSDLKRIHVQWTFWSLFHVYDHHIMWYDVRGIFVPKRYKSHRNKKCIYTKKLLK
jgi:hypothetical protein